MLVLLIMYAIFTNNNLNLKTMSEQINKSETKDAINSVLNSFFEMQRLSIIEVKKENNNLVKNNDISS